MARDKINESWQCCVPLEPILQVERYPFERTLLVTVLSNARARWSRDTGKELATLGSPVALAETLD